VPCRAGRAREFYALGIMLETFGAIVSIFAFHPIRCAVVAALFTVALIAPGMSRRSRIVLGVVALGWWAFAILEWMTPVQANIRLDLVVLGPIFLMMAVLGLFCFIASIR
jgi:hypothetical protein